MSIDRSFIGREFPPVSLLVTRSRLRNFAKATGQDQPVYTGVDAAKQAGFQVRFAAITPVHGQPTCTGVVASIDQVDGERQATFDLQVSLPDGTVTLLGSAVLVIPAPD
jgi:acyl dehydratase